MKEKKLLFDICFIGAGISCSYTLINLIELLQQHPKQNKLKIAIIDKANEFWTGIPYGKRSGFNSLVITSLKEFLPEEERTIFKQWLQQHFEQISTDYQQAGGEIALQWLRNNQSLIASEAWDKMYIPRYIFGLFIKERMASLMANAVKKDLIEYELITAEVTDVHYKNDLYQIAATNIKEIIDLQGKKVILSIGSPPKQSVPIACTGSQQYLCIQDMYEPGMQQSIAKIETFLNTGASQKNILLLGSNASSLEVIYNLQNSEKRKELINKIFILSPNGRFPHRINEDSVLNNYIPSHLAALKKAAPLTCRQMLEAVQKDVEVAEHAHIPIADIYSSVSMLLIDLLNNLSAEELKLFISKYGVEIGKLQRRAGSEYLNVVDILINESKIQFVKGKFLRQVHEEDGRFHFEYADTLDGTNKMYKMPMDVVINCIGAEYLDNSLTPLIQSLMNRKICEVNGTYKGFIVDENFKCHNHLYVIGPLLSGTLNSRLRVWHAESCTRIFFLAQQLASVLTSE